MWDIGTLGAMDQKVDFESQVRRLLEQAKRAIEEGRLLIAEDKLRQAQERIKEARLGQKTVW